MKKLHLVTLFALVNSVAAFAQDSRGFSNQYVDLRVMGRGFAPEPINDVEGTPYLRKDFSIGSLLTEDNKVVSKIQVKYDVFKNSLTYKNDNGVEATVEEPIKRFLLVDEEKSYIFQSGFPAIDNWDRNTYYEVLNLHGNVFLLKKLYKTLISGQPFKSSKVTDSYLDATKYYVFTENKEMLKFKTDRKSLAGYFGDKQKLVLDYIDKNEINLKEDADLGRVFDYYNSLK